MPIKQMTADINRKCDEIEAKLGVIYSTLGYNGLTIANVTTLPSIQLSDGKWIWRLDKITLRTLIVARILFGGKLSRMD